MKSLQLYSINTEPFVTKTKMNSALVLSVVFIFKILFFNVGILSFSATQQYAEAAIKNSPVSASTNWGNPPEAFNNLTHAKSSLQEFYEEGDTSENGEIDISPFFLIGVFYCLTKVRLSFFFGRFPYASLHRHAMLQVFQI